MRPWKKSLGAQAGIEDDRKLVECILAGDRQAWEMLVHRLKNRFWLILRMDLGLAEDHAADLFQDFFVHLQADDCRRLQAWQGRSRLDSYLAVVIRRLGLDFLRRQGRDQPLEVSGEGGEGPSDADPRPDEALLLAERRQAVADCLGRLLNRDRQFLNGRHGEDLSYRDLAAQFGLTVNAVGVALHRAEARLRQCLRDRFPSLFGTWEPVPVSM